jgi:fatty acid synthase
MSITLIFNCFFTGDLQFTITVQKASGKFEIVENNATVVSGLVRVPANASQEMVSLEPLKPLINDELLELSSRDIYKELRLSGYNYQGLFRGLVYADNYGGYHCKLQE